MPLRLSSVRGRSRVRAVLDAARARDLRSCAAEPGCAELLVLVRGARNSVERNRIRRRVRAAVREVIASDASEGGVIVLRPGRAVLKQEWRSLLDATRAEIRSQIGAIS